MDKKGFFVSGIALIVIQAIVSCGIFVTYPQMVAYAASKDNLETITKSIDALDRNFNKRFDSVENKIDKLESRKADKECN